MDKIQQILEGLGFDEKESAVYLACLEMDRGTNSVISKKTKLNRITNYEVLKRLQKRGVVGSFEMRGVQHFVATDPRSVISGIHQKVKLAEKMLPEFLAVANQSVKKPKIYFYEGIDGIKSVYEDSLNSKTEILTWTNPKDLYKYLGGEYVDEYVAERTRRKIRVRGLAPDNPLGKESREKGVHYMREARIFPLAEYEIGNEIMMYDNKICLFSAEDQIGLVIENQILSSTFRNIWKMAWDNAKE